MEKIWEFIGKKCEIYGGKNVKFNGNKSKI